MKVRKYDGRIQPYNEKNIAESIFKAARRVGGRNYKVAERLAKEVTNYLREKYPDVEILDTNTIGDAVEKILIEFGHAKTAKAFILHRERKKRARERIKVVRKLKEKLDTTDRLLLVSGVTKSTYEPWNKLRIVEYLQKLLGLSSEDAFEIADNVESKIIKSGMQRISTSLIRALIENELFELGYTAELEKQNVIGIPIEELECMISEMSNENANTIANNPEAVNLAIAEKVLKQYALQNIFSKDVADAHLNAAIHIHDLGYPVRVYCSSHSIEYIKKYGLELLNLTTTSSPAKHAMTLTGHINTFLASMQAYYAGALGLGFANIFYAPLTKSLSDKELLQQMQYLIFSCSQNAFSRGGQSLTYNEKIWIEENGMLRLVEIGKLVDKMIKENAIEYLPDGTVLTKNNPNGLRAISFNDNGQIELIQITTFAKIPFKGKIYKIITNKGVIDGITGSHSVFIWDGNSFVAREASKLKEGDYIISASKINFNLPTMGTFSIASFYLNREEAGNEIRVFDAEEKFKKELKRKYGKYYLKKFSEEYKIPVERVRTNWLRYKKIPLKFYVEIVGVDENVRLIYKGDSQATISANIPITKELVRLLGYYCSEGHNNEKRKTFIAISNKEKPLIEDAIACLKFLGYKYYRIHKSKGIYSLVIQGILAKLISDLCEESGMKKLPFFIYNLPKEMQNEFLNAFWRGDGLKSRKSYAIANTSKDVISGIAMLLAMQHKQLSIFFRSYPNSWKDLFELREVLDEYRIIDHKLSREFYGRKGLRKRAINLQEDITRSKLSTELVEKAKMLLNADIGFARILRIETYDYDGYVYDISVPGTESFLGGTGLLFFHNTLFIDLNVHLGVPDYMKDIPAIGSKGKYMLEKPNGVIEYINEVPRDEEGNVIQPTNGRILTYGDFEEEAQRVAKAMLDVWRAGDSLGQVFPFPKCDLHINQQCFDDPKQRELLDYACLIASENGAPYFVFDREECTLSMCCRLRYKIKQNYMLKYPESIRFCGFQNVTVNLPQAAYRAKGDIDKTLKEINNALDLVLKAHLQKKDFIAKLLKPGMPLWQLGKIAKDGRPYLELDKATYIVGLLGLNECVKFLIGQELHESNEAYKLGLKIISAMYLRIKQYEKEYGLHFSLEESPAESASYRLARVDLQRFPEAAKIVKGDIAKREVYYTNSCHFAADAPIDIIERIEKQGRFNTLIESGAITHVFLGEQKPDPRAVFKLVEKTWKNTNSAQITISPEFTICRDCGRISRGYKRFSKARREALIKALNEGR